MQDACCGPREAVCELLTRNGLVLWSCMGLDTSLLQAKVSCHMEEEALHSQQPVQGKLPLPRVHPWLYHWLQCRCTCSGCKLQSLSPSTQFDMQQSSIYPSKTCFTSVMLQPLHQSSESRPRPRPHRQPTFLPICLLCSPLTMHSCFLTQQPVMIGNCLLAPFLSASTPQGFPVEMRRLQGSSW